MCQFFCDINDDCKGVIYWRTVVRICIGVSNVDRDAGVSADDLAKLLNIKRPPNDPTCMVKATIIG